MAYCLSDLTCCVPGCSNNSGIASVGTSWHRFPKDKDLAEKWMSFVGGASMECRDGNVCSLHFRKEDFVICRTLSPIAVPSIFNFDEERAAEKGEKRKFEKVDPSSSAADESYSAESTSNSDDGGGVNVKRPKLDQQKTVEELMKENQALKTRNGLLVDEMTELKKKYEKVDDGNIKALELPINVWQHILGFLPDIDVVNLSAVSKKLQSLVHTVKGKFDLHSCCRLNSNLLLDYALSSTCSSINLNDCHWLDPRIITEIVQLTRGSLNHLHVINCRVDDDSIISVCNLELKSLSFSYTSTWHEYSIFKAEKILPCFENLTKLTISFKLTDFGTAKMDYFAIIYNLFTNVLPRCRELEHFELDECRFALEGRLQLAKFPSLESTLLPKLKSFIYNDYYDNEIFNNANHNVWKNGNDISVLLNLILKDKVIPLEHVDVGRHTSTVLHQGEFLENPLIMEKETLSIRGIEWGLVHKLNELDSLVGRQGPYKTLFFKHASLFPFADFISTILLKSRESIQEVYLNGYIDETALRGIQLLAVQCPQITVLDLALYPWFNPDCTVRVDGVCYYKNSGIEKNQALLETISNFKNLKKLSLAAMFLACGYYKADALTKFHQAMPFWKVIQSCEWLRKIRISNNSHSLCEVHMDSIYDISRCKNLEVLQLSDFRIRGSSDFQLTNVTKHCSKLRELKITKVSLLPNIDGDHHVPRFDVENSLSFTKNLQILTFKSAEPYFSKAFVDNVGLCRNLEVIRLWVKNYNAEDVRCLMNLLPNLKFLSDFRIEFDKGESLTENWNPLFSKIRREKPGFSGNIGKASFDK